MGFSTPERIKHAAVLAAVKVGPGGVCARGQAMACRPTLTASARERPRRSAVGAEEEPAERSKKEEGKTCCVIACWWATSLAGFCHLDHAEIITYPDAPSLWQTTELLKAMGRGPVAPEPVCAQASALFP